MIGGRFPIYDKNDQLVRKFNPTTASYEPDYIEIKIDKPFESVEDVKQYLITYDLVKKIEDCESMKDCITNQKFFTKAMKSQYDLSKKHIKNAFSQIPLNFRDEYKPMLTTLEEELTKSYKSSVNVVYANKDELFAFLDEKKNDRLNSWKEKRREANKRYYEKQKQLLGLGQKSEEAVEEPSAEEKLAKFRKQQRDASKKYYEKKKQELGIGERTLLTEEEKRERRREANRKYYESKKSSKTDE